MDLDQIFKDYDNGQTKQAQEAAELKEKEAARVRRFKKLSADIFTPFFLQIVSLGQQRRMIFTVEEKSEVVSPYYEIQVSGMPGVSGLMDDPAKLRITLLNTDTLDFKATPGALDDSLAFDNSSLAKLPINDAKKADIDSALERWLKTMFDMAHKISKAKAKEQT